jgi:pimeloyl-ACP methyl ester carboxylesterase
MVVPFVNIITAGFLSTEFNRADQRQDSHDTCDRLGKITAPTLVITGDSDRVIPP